MDGDDKIAVLVIDDSPSDRRIYRRFLTDQFAGKIEIVEATTGAEGVAICHAQIPDCILLDYKLPDTVGIEVLKKIRGLGPIPVIMITGNDQPLLQTQSHANGAVKFLSKDFLNSQLLADAIRESLNTSRTNRKSP